MKYKKLYETVFWLKYIRVHCNNELLFDEKNKQSMRCMKKYSYFIMIYQFKIYDNWDSHVSLRINFLMNKFIKICRFICIIYVSFECEIYSGFKFCNEDFIPKLMGYFWCEWKKMLQNLCALLSKGRIKVCFRWGD